MANAKAPTYERVIPLDDNLLLDLVKQKGEMVDQGRAIATQMEDLAKQHDKLNTEQTALITKVTNKKLDIFKRVEKLAKPLLGEFEIPVTTEIRDGKVVLIVTDALTEFRDSFKRFDKWKEPVPKKDKKSTT
jgi:predicted secreted acid phosphatase